MENVDDIGIAQRFLEEHVIVVVPICPGGNDRMLRCCLADRRCQFCFYSIPTIRVTKLRLIQNLEEHTVRIVGRVMLRHGAPEIGEALDCVILFRQSRFEV